MFSSKSTTKQKWNTKDQLLLDAVNRLSSFKISELIKRHRYSNHIIQKALITIMDKNENSLIDPNTEYGSRFFCIMSLIYEIDGKTPRNHDRKCIYEAIKKGILSRKEPMNVGVNDTEDPLILKNKSLDDGRLKVIDYFLLRLYNNKLNKNDKEALLSLAIENKNPDVCAVLLKYFKGAVTPELIESAQQHINSFSGIYKSENSINNNNSTENHSEKQHFEDLSNNNVIGNSENTLLYRFILNANNNDINQPDLTPVKQVLIPRNN